MNQRTEFAWVGGHACLDFVNTAGGATKSRNIERLGDYRAAVRWARIAGLITTSEERKLRALADAHPQQAADQLAILRAEREDSYAVLLAIAAEQVPHEREIARIGSYIKDAVAIARLAMPRSKPCAWIVPATITGLGVIRHRIALTMAEILTGEDRLNIRECEACSWLFLDRSPTKRRRWCSMAACGNRAKARRHYQRQPGAQ